jgi:hypothetical protein
MEPGKCLLLYPFHKIVLLLPTFSFLIYMYHVSNKHINNVKLGHLTTACIMYHPYCGPERQFCSTGVISAIQAIIPHIEQLFRASRAYSALRSMFRFYRRLFSTPLDSIVAYSALRSMVRFYRRLFSAPLDVSIISSLIQGSARFYRCLFSAPLNVSCLSSRLCTPNKRIWL